MKKALLVIGAIFTFGLYPITVLWPSGWSWHVGQSEYLQMIIGIHFTLGVFFVTINEPISMGQLVHELQISKSIASVEIRRLLKMGHLEKVLISDYRADFCQLKKDVWITLFFQKKSGY